MHYYFNGKSSLYDSVSLHRPDNETTESDSTTLSSSKLNVEPRYFGDELKSLCTNNVNRIIIDRINRNSIRTKFDDLVK